LEMVFRPALMMAQHGSSPNCALAPNGTAMRIINTAAGKTTLGQNRPSALVPRRRRKSDVCMIFPFLLLAQNLLHALVEVFGGCTALLDQHVRVRQLR